MNLHGLVSGVIGVVNPMQAVKLQISSGYTTRDDGTQVPQYLAPRTMRAQVQDLSQSDVQHLDSLNIQDSQKTMYLNGDLSGMVRPSGKGGDLVTTADGSLWLVTAVMEQWPDWARVAVTLQNGA